MDHQNELPEVVEIDTLSETDLEEAAGGFCSFNACSNSVDPN